MLNVKIKQKAEGEEKGWGFPSYMDGMVHCLSKVYDAQGI